MRDSQKGRDHSHRTVLVTFGSLLGRNQDGAEVLTWLCKYGVCPVARVKSYLSGLSVGHDWTSIHHSSRNVVEPKCVHNCSVRMVDSAHYRASDCHHARLSRRSPLILNFLAFYRFNYVVTSHCFGNQGIALCKDITGLYSCKV